MMQRKHSHSAGFTVIELMIATAVFAIVLTVATVAIMRIVNQYYHGVIAVQTQSIARTTISDISQAIQFSGEPITPSTSTPSPTAPNGPKTTGGLTAQSMCIGTKRYTYAINAQVDDKATGYTAATQLNRHGLWQDTIIAGRPCTTLDLTQASPTDPNTNAAIPGKELLSEHMRLGAFNVTQTSTDPLVYQITIDVFYGDHDLIEFNGPGETNPKTCLGGVTGAQWCSHASLTTQVLKRIK